MNLTALRTERRGVADAMRAILDRAEAAGQHDIAGAALATFNQHRTRLQQLDVSILEAEIAADARNKPPAARVEMGSGRGTLDPTGGYASFGEFAFALRRHAILGPRAADPRLDIIAAAPGTTGSAGVGADGGFLVPQAFAEEVTTHAGADDLLPLCDVTPIKPTSMMFPVDETTPWGTDGIRAYWQAEATAATPTKPKLRGQELRLNKLMALVPLTDELAADAPALNSYLPAKVGDSIRWKVNEGILTGAGNGQPVGCMNSGAAIVVPKESGQLTQTLQIQNLARMASRLPPHSFRRAVWLVHPDALVALLSMSAPLVQLGPIPAWFKGNAVGGLLGIPVIPSAHCAPFSSQGDVMLVDLSYYRAIVRDPLLQPAMSMHMFFDAAATAYRVTCRLDGAPKISAPLSAPPGGSNTASPFLALGAR